MSLASRRPRLGRTGGAIGLRNQVSAESARLPASGLEAGVLETDHRGASSASQGGEGDGHNGLEQTRHALLQVQANLPPPTGRVVS